MKITRRCTLLLAICQAVTTAALGDAPKSATRNVVLITADGVRWQEVFRGAEETLLNQKDGGVTDVDALRREVWRATPQARREALMPFFGARSREKGSSMVTPTREVRRKSPTA